MRQLLLPIGLALLLPAPAAYAYVDPGAGSMLLQLLLGGVAGAFVAFRLMRNRIAAMFGRKRDDADRR